jgi:hypothetical protein
MALYFGVGALWSYYVYFAFGAPLLPGCGGTGGVPAALPAADAADLLRVQAASYSSRARSRWPRTCGSR